PNGPPTLSIDASQDGPPAAVWKGPIPPGQAMVSVAFFLKQRGSLTFRQVASLRFEGLRVGVGKLAELHVEGVTDIEERKLQGRAFMVASPAGPSPGGTIELTLTGLPVDFYILRVIAALGALAIALVFVYLAIYHRPADDDGEADKKRQKLMARREALLD